PTRSVSFSPPAPLPPPPPRRSRFPTPSPKPWPGKPPTGIARNRRAAPGLMERQQALSYAPGLRRQRGFARVRRRTEVIRVWWSIWFRYGFRNSTDKVDRQRGQRGLRIREYVQLEGLDKIFVGRKCPKKVVPSLWRLIKLIQSNRGVRPI